ncbi:MAG: YheV family putative metal-binding protein [Gammaproteobacteria bacterium]|jgi:hypothetical protein|nr:YheV family putative metal-binding protein [Gammaproteobacteria bacterium]
MFKSNRRFIAGAVCPKCGEVDKLVVYTENDDQYRECVACDYIDKMNFQSAPKELETRVNRTEEEKKSEVQIIDLSSLDRKK